jgi:hypothetical protein
MDTDEKCAQVLVGKLEGKRPLRRRKRRWGVILKLMLKKYSVSD